MNDDRKTPPTFAPSDPSALDWARVAGISDEVMRRTELRVRRRRRRTAFFAGGLVASILLGLSITSLRRPLPTSTSQAPSSTIVSRPVQRALPDGSLVELKAGAEIAVDFSGQLRRVELTRGEAHFQVAHDAVRAFIVVARGVEVRAVGTAFSVDLAQQSVEVLVTEGRVTVSAVPAEDTSAGKSAASQVYVDAGHRAFVAVEPNFPASGATQVSAVSDGELSDRLSWRVPRLEFVGTPLAEAIPMFNEHSARWHGARIMMGDAELGRLQLSGIIRADNTDTLLRVLAAEFGIKAEHQGANVIVLRKN